MKVIIEDITEKINCSGCTGNDNVKSVDIKNSRNCGRVFYLCKTCRRILQNKLQEEVVNEFEEQNE